MAVYLRIGVDIIFGDDALDAAALQGIQNTIQHTPQTGAQSALARLGVIFPRRLQPDAAVQLVIPPIVVLCNLGAAGEMPDGGFHASAQSIQE